MLRLFGVPFIDAPFEAEAQCAALEELGVVDGVVTNDSDVLLFGAQNVYRNMFRADSHIEHYTAPRIAERCGLERGDLIDLALLLGSDYTDGVRGVGYVRAAELVSTFKPIGGMTTFARWYADGESVFDDADAPLKVAPSARRMLRRLRPTIVLGDAFPDRHVVAAYRAPRVDESITRDTQFVWSRPSFDALRRWTEARFGWSEEHADRQLRLVIERYSEALHEPRQRTLPSFFGSARPVVQRVDSARLKSAMSKLRGEKQPDDDGDAKAKAKRKRSTTSTAGNKKRRGAAVAAGAVVATKAKRGRSRKSKSIAHDVVVDDVVVDDDVDDDDDDDDAVDEEKDDDYAENNASAKKPSAKKAKAKAKTRRQPTKRSNTR